LTRASVFSVEIERRPSPSRVCFHFPVRLFVFVVARKSYLSGPPVRWSTDRSLGRNGGKITKNRETRPERLLDDTGTGYVRVIRDRRQLVLLLLLDSVETNNVNKSSFFVFFNRSANKVSLG